MIDTIYMDAARPGWRTEEINSLVAWTHTMGTKWLDVSWLDFGMWIAQFDLRPAIANKVTTGTDAERTAAQHFLDVLVAGHTLAASDPRVRSVVAAALPAGAARDALLTLATSASMEHWQVMDLPMDRDDTVRAVWLQQARA